MRFYILILAGALACALPLNSQNREFRNAIHAKINVIDYGMLDDGPTRISQGFELGYFRNIAQFLNVGVPFKMAVAKLPGKADNTVTTSLDLLFHLENIRDNAKISPYLFGGAGLFSEALKARDTHFPFGAGINFRISRYAFVNLQGEFRKAMADRRDNVQLGLGFVYLLHKPENLAPPPPPDMDGDSIPDLADHCPEVKGPASALGCPDKDDDGLGDIEDKCPDQKGSLETEGCPDQDNDGLADNLDKCPTLAGTLDGCPDTDADGVADKEDKCPNKPGTANGCPDRDNDGYSDDDDDCPDAAGRWNGCPDTDFDGVPDKEDLCPQDPGSASNKGCPIKKDSDGDGIDDFDDACPDVVGTVLGCPDKDKDNIPDKDDKCPDVPGPVQGCPDTDADGVVDKDDPCPQTSGKFGGCPDTDGDGVADNLDKCPNSPGVASANGCPEIKKETKERLAFATKAVQFETAKATLKMESYAILDELFGILKQYPDYKLVISGHTDDTGTDEENLALSTERAKACYDYLVFRGTKTERLRYAGFGEQRPIAANTTNAGRELNRRVEFELLVE